MAQLKFLPWVAPENKAIRPSSPNHSPAKYPEQVQPLSVDLNPISQSLLELLVGILVLLATFYLDRPLQSILSSPFSGLKFCRI